MNLNLAPSPFPMEQTKEKEHDENQETFTFGLNHHRHHQIVSSSSSSSASCHIFFNQAQDHAGFFHPQLYQPHHHPLQDDYYSYRGGSSYEIENKVEKGLKLSLQKKEDENMLAKERSSGDRVKWMPRLMKKKDEERSMMNGCSAKMEVKKVKQSSSMETDLSSNSSSYNCSTPIRVCSDCHTTKTPLWRSGPKGPKSLCNACGIRQRKARRAMAVAAAGGDGGGVACDTMKVKVKVKMGKSGMKKRCKSGGELEEFLIRLSEKLAIHRVFPQDEKEAAILLMALSSGLVHG